jgi:nucleoside transport protein
VGILISSLGILVTGVVAWLMSNDKKNINFKAVGILFVLQLLISWFMLTTSIGGVILKSITGVFNKIMMFGNEGINFVAGGWIPEGHFVMFVNVLLLIVFTSTLLSILNYIRILPLIIKYLGGLISKLTGIPNVIAFSTVASSVFGDTGALLAVKNHIPAMNRNRLFITTTASMTSVSASIVASYMTMIPAEYVLVALPLNVLSGLILASMVAPVKAEDEQDISIKDMIPESNIFEAIGNGALDGLKVAGIVAGMLIAYISLMAMINFGFEHIVGVKLEVILGYILSPVAFIMGVPMAESVKAGSVMATKVLTNEFVAMLGFKEMIPHLSAKTVAVVSTFLVSFANFSSIGIIQGTVAGFHKGQSVVVAKFGLKMLLVATMASMLSATIVGLFM